MANNAIETVMGAVVLAVAGGFLYFAYNNSNVKPIEGYALTANFSNISGISPGSSVRVGGIKIGVVEGLTLDPQTFQAVANLRIGNDIKLPKDSIAAVMSTGLIGEKFMAIEPGGDEEAMKNGDRIAFTQPSVSLEEMIGKFVFSGGGADKDDASDSASVTPQLETPKAVAPKTQAPAKVEAPVKAEAAPKVETPKPAETTPSIKDEAATLDSTLP